MDTVAGLLMDYFHGGRRQGGFHADRSAIGIAGFATSRYFAILRDLWPSFAIPLSCPGLPCLVGSRSTLAGSDDQARFTQPLQITLQRAPRGRLPKRPERHLVMDKRCIPMDKVTLSHIMYLSSR